LLVCYQRRKIKIVFHIPFISISLGAMKAFSLD
jgi:uncharacterized membrane protein YwzB